MSRKVNIMTEVSDEVYEGVVTKYKKNKSFSKLVALLLEGFATNVNIRSYFEDLMAGESKRHQGQLEDFLNCVRDVLVNEEMLSEEAKSTMQKGADVFGEASEKAEATVGTEEIRAAVSEETKDLREAVDKLTTQTSLIASVLQQLLQQGNQNTSTSPKQVVEYQKSPVPSTGVKNIVEGGASAVPEQSVWVQEKNYAPVSGANSAEESSATATVSKQPAWVQDKSYAPVTSVKEAEEALKNSKRLYDDDEDDVIIPLITVEEEQGEVNGEDVLASLLSGNTYSF